MSGHYRALRQGKIFPLIVFHVKLICIRKRVGGGEGCSLRESINV